MKASTKIASFFVIILLFSFNKSPCMHKKFRPQRQLSTIFLKNNQRILVTTRTYNEHEASIYNGLDQKLYKHLLSKYEKKQLELKNAKSAVFKSYSILKKTNQESLDKLEDELINIPIMIGAIVGLSSFDIAHDLPTALLGGFTCGGLYPQLRNAWILKHWYYSAIKACYTARNKYKQLLPEYRDLATKINHPIECTTNDIDFFYEHELPSINSDEIKC